MNNLLELKGVSKSFPGFELQDISFTLPKGYIMGLIGSNGAGKTTTIKLILNMLPRDGGEILLLGEDNTINEGRLKENIGIVFDSVFYVDSWTVKDTEKAVSMFYDKWSHETFLNLLKRFDLPANKKVRELSRGMQMKLMLACAFSHDARLLILDEPTSGLDPGTREEFLELLQEFIEDGERSVLFSTHITTDLERVSDYVTLINDGKLFYTGSMEKLLDEFRIIKGNPHELTPELEGKIIGQRKTSVGFEGLISKKAGESGNYILDSPTINDIAVYISKGGKNQ